MKISLSQFEKLMIGISLSISIFDFASEARGEAEIAFAAAQAKIAAIEAGTRKFEAAVSADAQVAQSLITAGTAEQKIDAEKDIAFANALTALDIAHLQEDTKTERLGMTLSAQAFAQAVAYENERENRAMEREYQYKLLALKEREHKDRLEFTRELAKLNLTQAGMMNPASAATLSALNEALTVKSFFPVESGQRNDGTEKPASNNNPESLSTGKSGNSLGPDLSNPTTEATPRSATSRELQRALEEEGNIILGSTADSLQRIEREEARPGRPSVDGIPHRPSREEDAFHDHSTHTH